MDLDGHFFYYIRDKSRRTMLLVVMWFFALMWALLGRADQALITLLVEPSRFTGQEAFDLIVLALVVVGPVIAAPFWVLNNLRVAAAEEEAELQRSLGHVPEPDEEPEGLPLNLALAGMGLALLGILTLAFVVMPFLDLGTEAGGMALALLIVVPVGAAMNHFMMGDDD